MSLTEVTALPIPRLPSLTVITSPLGTSLKARWVQVPSTSRAATGASLSTRHVRGELSVRRTSSLPPGSSQSSVSWPAAQRDTTWERVRPEGADLASDRAGDGGSEPGSGDEGRERTQSSRRTGPADAGSRRAAQRRPQRVPTRSPRLPQMEGERRVRDGQHHCRESDTSYVLQQTACTRCVIRLMPAIQ